MMVSVLMGVSESSCLAGKGRKAKAEARAAEERNWRLLLI
jgi:hypothetical protein